MQHAESRPGHLNDTVLPTRGQITRLNVHEGEDSACVLAHWSCLAEPAAWRLLTESTAPPTQAQHLALSKGQHASCPVALTLPSFGSAQSPEEVGAPSHMARLHFEHSMCGNVRARTHGLSPMNT